MFIHQSHSLSLFLVHFLNIFIDQYVYSWKSEFWMMDTVHPSHRSLFYVPRQKIKNQLTFMMKMTTLDRIVGSMTKYNYNGCVNKRVCLVLSMLILLVLVLILMLFQLRHTKQQLPLRLRLLLVYLCHSCRCCCDGSCVTGSNSNSNSSSSRTSGPSVCLPQLPVRLRKIMTMDA